jgi:hypothetical protein
MDATNQDAFPISHVQRNCSVSHMTPLYQSGWKVVWHELPCGGLGGMSLHVPVHVACTSTCRFVSHIPPRLRRFTWHVPPCAVCNPMYFYAPVQGACTSTCRFTWHVSSCPSSCGMATRSGFRALCSRYRSLKVLHPLSPRWLHRT